MDILYSGLLKDNHPFYIRRLHLKDLDEIIHVQNEVVYVLDNPSSLSSLSQKEYEYILAGGGKMVGVFADERLVAFRALLVPGAMKSILVQTSGLIRRNWSLLFIRRYRLFHRAIVAIVCKRLWRCLNGQLKVETISTSAQRLLHSISQVSRTSFHNRWKLLR